MKIQLTLQEKLKDLRTERKLTLDELAQQVGLSKSSLSKYESDGYNDISPYSLGVLARFYGVSADYLLGLTENRTQGNTELAELHLNDYAVELLKSGKINNRLLSEIMLHPGFAELMADIEIYVDGIAAMPIVQMNDYLDAVRTQILQEHNPDRNDLYLRLLEKAKIDEEEYFFHVTDADWKVILRDIRKTHIRDFENAGTTEQVRIAPNLMKQYQLAMRKANPIEGVLSVFCESLGIDESKLSVDERNTMITLMKRSKLLRTVPNHHRRKK